MDKCIKAKNYFLWIFIVLVVFLVLQLTNVFDNTVKNVVGLFVWIIIHYIFLIILLFVPFIVGLFSKKRRTIIVWSFVGLILYLLVNLTTHFFVYDYIREFTPKKWALYKYERHFMLDDLNDKYKLTDMSFNDVKNLLGEPEFNSGNEMEYVIDDGWIDPEMFVLVLKDYKVVDQYVYTEFKPQR